MEAHTYHVGINWEHSRKGLLCSPELNKEKGVCIEVATPPEFPRGMAGIWSPEHLFVAAVTGKLEKVEGESLMIYFVGVPYSKVLIEIRIEVDPDLSEST